MAFLLVATAGGTLLPTESPVADTIDTLEATPSELFPLFNSRAGQRRIWTGSGMSLDPLGGPDEGVGSHRHGAGPPTVDQPHQHRKPHHPSRQGARPDQCQRGPTPGQT
jgi:hypothetical protein